MKKVIPDPDNYKHNSISGAFPGYEGGEGIIDRRTGNVGTNQPSYYQQMYANNKILQNIIDILPNKALADYPLFFDDSHGDKKLSKKMQKRVIKELNKIRFIGSRPYTRYNWSSFWETALKLADIEGNAYVIIGDNSLDTELPLPDNYRLEYLALRSTVQMYQNENSLEFYEVPISDNTTDKEFNQFMQVEQKVRLFHHTRVIKLFGIENMEQQFRGRNLDYSVLKPILCEYLNMQNTMAISREMFSQFSFYVHKITGLSKAAAKNGLQSLKNRFRDIMEGINLMGGLFIDKENEEAEVISRNFSGVDAFMEKHIDWFVSNTGLPRFVVMGKASEAALSTSGEQEQKTLNALVHDYQRRKYLPILELLVVPMIERMESELLALNDDSDEGESIDDLDIEITFLPTYPMSAKEEAEIRKLKAEAEAIELKNNENELTMENRVIQSDLSVEQSQVQLEQAKNPPEPTQSSDNNNFGN